MKTKIYLVFNANGFVVARKNIPALTSGEIGVGVTVEIPNKWFYRSMPELSITLPEPPIAEATVNYDPKFIEPEIEGPQ